MGSPSGSALLGRAAGTVRAATGRSGAGRAGAAGSDAAARKSTGDLRAHEAGPLWMRVLPPVVTFAVMLIGITVPSYWRDEAATLAAVRRPFGDMIRMLGNVDAVHGAYYTLIWVLVRLFGTGEFALRLPSAIAMAVAAGFVAALGRRLVSPRAGLFAGLLFAVVPDISLYGQDARSYAMVTAVATICSYALVRALGAWHGLQRRWWIIYALSVALLGILNIFGLLLIAGHGMTIALRMIRPEPGQSRRALLLRWLAAVGTGLVVASPLIVLGWRQRGQISWLTAPGYAGLSSVTKLIGPPAMSLTVVAAVAAGLAIAASRAPEHKLPAWFTTLPGLCLPWLILPPAILLIGSVVTPVYNFRYILFCVPAAVLLGGAGLAALGRIGGTAVLVAVAILSLQSQVFFRTPGGHGDNIRQADALIAASSQPGDVILYTNPNAESFGGAYTYGLSRLRNIQLARGPIASNTLGGVNVSPDVLHTRLAHASRLWIVEIDASASARPLLQGLHYHLIWIWRTSDIWLRLYVRAGTPAYAAARPSILAPGAARHHTARHHAGRHHGAVAARR